MGRSCKNAGGMRHPAFFILGSAKLNVGGKAARSEVGLGADIAKRDGGILVAKKRLNVGKLHAAVVGDGGSGAPGVVRRQAEGFAERGGSAPGDDVANALAGKTTGGLIAVHAGDGVIVAVEEGLPDGDLARDAARIIGREIGVVGVGKGEKIGEGCAGDGDGIDVGALAAHGDQRDIGLGLNACQRNAAQLGQAQAGGKGDVQEGVIAQGEAAAAATGAQHGIDLLEIEALELRVPERGDVGGGLRARRLDGGGGAQMLAAIGDEVALLAGQGADALGGKFA